MFSSNSSCNSSSDSPVAVSDMDVSFVGLWIFEHFFEFFTIDNVIVKNLSVAVSFFLSSLHPGLVVKQLVLVQEHAQVDI